MGQEQEQKEQQQFHKANRQQTRLPEGSSSHASETRAAYSRNFKRFLEHIKMPDLQVLLDQKPRVLTQMIIEYVDYLREDYQSKKGLRLSRSSIDLHCASIRDFLDTNYDDFDSIPWRRIKRHLPPDESTHDDRAYTVEEIQRMLYKCDERSKVIVLLMASSGMRIGAIHELRTGNLTPTKVLNQNVYKIWVYARWKSDRYYTFCTPECAAAIDTYLAYRQRFGEVLTPEAPLIREQFNVDRHLRQKPLPVSRAEIIYLVSEALRRSGVRTKEVMRAHGLRKYAITQMIKAKVDYNARKYLVGHGHSRIDLALDVSYDRTEQEVRLAEYSKAIPFLTINPTQRLQKENQELKSDRSELARLKAQLHKNQQTIGETKALMKVAKAHTDNMRTRMNEIMSIIKRVQDPQYQHQLQQEQEQRIRQRIMQELQQRQQQPHQKEQQ